MQSSHFPNHFCLSFQVVILIIGFAALASAKPSWGPWGWGHGAVVHGHGATIVGPSAAAVSISGPVDHGWGHWGGYGWGHHGAVVAGPHAEPAVIAGPSGKIIVDGHHGHWW